MDRLPMIRGLFAVAGLYDGLLGLAFVVAGPALFLRLGIAPPNHWGYVHFTALLLIVFGIMFFAVARDPVQNRNLIPYGAMLKLCYSGTVFYHWWAGNLATAWKPFAFIDLFFLVLFLWAYRFLHGARER
jgi:hypothetical protein